MPAKDESVVLLREIRDLLKENQAVMLSTKAAHHRSIALKIIFNGAIFLFVCVATYLYYHTLVTSLGG